jgi:hypothetical protein
VKSAQEVFDSDEEDNNLKHRGTIMETQGRKATTALGRGNQFKAIEPRG